MTSGAMVNRDISLQRCDMMTDAIQSIIMKLRLFETPVRPAVPAMRSPKSRLYTVHGVYRQCLVFAMTLLYFREVIWESSLDLPSKQTNAVKIAYSLIEQVRLRTNKALDQLTSCLAKYEATAEKYASHFAKNVEKLKKQLDQCVSKFEILVEYAQLPALSKTMYHLKQMMLTDEQLFREELELHDLFEAFKTYVIELARFTAMRTLEGDIHGASQSSRRTAATMRDVMERRNKTIDALMQTSPSRAEPKRTLAQEQGFVSRTQTTRREPNWKIESKSAPSSPAQRTPKSAKQASPASYRSEGHWPLPDTGSSASPASHKFSTPSSLQPTAYVCDLDEVYDSYHDHEPDATLGIPGTAVIRQPSSKRLPRKTSGKNKLSPSPSVLRARDVAYELQMVGEQLQSLALSGANAEQDVLVEEEAPQAPGSFMVEDVRDQYY